MQYKLRQGGYKMIGKTSFRNDVWETPILPTIQLSYREGNAVISV